MRNWMQRLAWALALCLAGAGGAAAAAAENYLVGPGDKLNISILGRDGFSRIATVRGDGTVRLHLIGTIAVTGLTLQQIEDRIVERAGERFDGAVSAVADIEEYRPFYVLGNVAAPGAYPYAPGMTVIKAIALAGGYERAVAETADNRAIADAQRRALEAQIRLRFAEDEQRAIAAEIARLDGGGGGAEGLETGAAAVSPEQAALVGMGRAILEETVKGYQRREELAQAEAGIYAQRREIIARQLQVTEEQLAGINDLVAQGLSRRDRQVTLQVEVDEFRSDALETAAYAARARQTAANAGSEAGVAVTRYHRDLLAAKLDADQKVAMLRSSLNAAMDYLRAAAPQAAMAVGEELETVFEVYRDGEDGTAERVRLTSRLQPDQVLMVRFQGVATN